MNCFKFVALFFFLFCQKIKNKKYHTVWTIPKSKWKYFCSRKRQIRYP